MYMSIDEARADISAAQIDSLQSLIPLTEADYAPLRHSDSGRENLPGNNIHHPPVMENKIRRFLPYCY
jgi:hypothetical protein